MKCIVDEKIKQIPMTPAQFSKESGVSRQLLSKHKKFPQLNWRIESATRIVKTFRKYRVNIKLIDLMNRSLEVSPNRKAGEG